MQTICPDQKRSCELQTIAVVRLEQRPDAETVGVIAVAGHRHAGSDRASAEAFEDSPVEKHLQPAAMHGILRPAVAGMQATRFGVDLLAIESDQRPLARLQPD